MEGSGQVPGGYPGGGFDQRGSDMYGGAPGGGAGYNPQGSGYRRISSPPTMEHRPSPPTQYVSGSFPPPQMYQRNSGYQYPMGEGQKGMSPGRMFKRMNTFLNNLPWRYVSLVLFFVAAYALLQWRMCASGVTSYATKSTSTSSSTDAGAAGSFEDLKKELGDPGDAISSTTDSTAATTADGTDPAALEAAAETEEEDPASGTLAELRKFAVKPSSYDVNEILKHPLAKRIIVSEKGGVMYCPIPKAANSNWKYMIRKYEGFKDYEDLQKAHNREQSGLKYVEDYTPEQLEKLLADPNMLKFTFARDPIARTLSCYLNKFVTKEKDGDEYQVYMAQLFGWPWVNEHDLVNEPRPTFEQFVTQIATQNNDAMNEHWAPQSYLCGIGIFPFDFVGKLEEVDTYAPKVISWISKGAEDHFPSQDEIKFSSVGTQDLIEQYYTDTVKEQVKKTFKNDFELMRYSFTR